MALIYNSDNNKLATDVSINAVNENKSSETNNSKQTEVSDMDNFDVRR